MKYRAEISGLRGIALLSIMIYHAEVLILGKKMLGGSFICLDIFFVISGYLISKIILRELFESGSFRFLLFYEQRARRVLPTLFVVMVVSFPFAWNALQPFAFVEYCQSVLAAIFSSSNFFFYFSAIEYGAESSQLKPFLHTWSLGIEEQFYIIFPVMLWAAHRFLKNHLLTLLLAAFGVSFFVAATASNPDLNFYSPLSRFWELIAGALLAYYELKRGRITESLATKLASLLGLGSIAGSIIFFTDDMHHPGLITLIPIIGTVMVIAFASPQDWAGRILSFKPLAGLGLMSYSAYLWHFPLFAFARLDNATPHGYDNYDKFAWIVLTLLLAVPSYFLIEQPFRNKQKIPRRRLVILLGSLFLVAGGSSLVVIGNNGFEDRFSKISDYLTFERDWKKLRDSANSYLAQATKGEEEDKINVIIIGNSHSKGTFNAFHQNKSLYGNFNFYPAQYDVPYREWQTRYEITCSDPNNPETKGMAKALYSSPAYQKSDIVLIATRHVEKNRCLRSFTRKYNDLDGLPYLIERVLKDGKKIIILSRLTEFRHVENTEIANYYLSKAEKDGTLLDIARDPNKAKQFINKVNREAFKRRIALGPLNDKVKAIAATYKVPFFNKNPYICDEQKQTCTLITPDGHQAFFDLTHTTLKGAKFFGERMAEQVLKLLNEAAKDNPKRE